MRRKAGKKLYRSAAEGSTRRERGTETTRITLTGLTCDETEDNAGHDECELRIWADNSFQAHRKNMDNGDTWELNVTLEFSYRVKIELWDLDNPGFPLYDNHDHLGTCVIAPGQVEGSGTFNQDGADYRIDWVPAG